MRFDDNPTLLQWNEGGTRAVLGSYRHAVRHKDYRCFRGVSEVFQRCFRGVSGVFQGCFRGVLKMI